jgi:hypothetical protein
VGDCGIKSPSSPLRISREVTLMATPTNISSVTAANMFYKTGSLTVGGVNIGALEGDITFRVTRVYDTPALAGAAGDLKGNKYILREEAFLSCTVVEWQLSKIAKALAGIDVSSNVSSEVLGSSEDASDQVGCIDSGFYTTVVFTGTQCDGKSSTITLFNAIPDGDFEAVFRDQGHFSFPVTFKATYDPVDPDARPWAVVHAL